MKHSPGVFQWDIWITKEKVSIQHSRCIINTAVGKALCSAGKFIWIGGLRRVFDEGDSGTRKVDRIPISGNVKKRCSRQNLHMQTAEVKEDLAPSTGQDAPACLETGRGMWSEMRQEGQLELRGRTEQRQLGQGIQRPSRGGQWPSSGCL